MTHIPHISTPSTPFVKRFLVSWIITEPYLFMYLTQWLMCMYKSMNRNFNIFPLLTHWGQATHICVSKLTIICSDNGLSPGRSQAIIWTNDGILLIGTLRTNFSEILIEIYIFSFKKMLLKMPSGKWRPFCLGLIVLTKHTASVTCIIQKGKYEIQLLIWTGILHRYVILN